MLEVMRTRVGDRGALGCGMALGRDEATALERHGALFVREVIWGPPAFRAALADPAQHVELPSIDTSIHGSTVFGSADRLARKGLINLNA